MSISKEELLKKLSDGVLEMEDELVTETSKEVHSKWISCF